MLRPAPPPLSPLPDDESLLCDSSIIDDGDGRVDEPPLTDYEKVRARNMMRNNRMFQSLVIGAIASMIRKTNDVQEGRTNEVQEDAMTDKHRLRKGKGLERITKSLGTKANFEMNIDSETIKYACKDILQKSSKNRRHKIKKKYFDTVAANKVSTKSLVPDLTDGWEWAMAPFFLFHVSDQSRNNREHQLSKSTPYKEERKGEELPVVDLFKATQNSKKHGFSEPVKIAILEMEKMKDAPVPEGEEPKSDAEIVEELLKTEVKQSTFLRNVGLKSSSNNSGKGTAVVAALVHDLEKKLERSELQAKVMQEEMAAIKLKVEEYEAARDKELEMLRKKSQEHEEKIAHLMALFGAKAS
ncbi:hypothetical protein D1007_61806 [Hordeum vulgare]|nr:hypothetical protein D1007_61806 [Hordeum vulgare]